MRETEPVKLVIADDEQLICGLLAKTIDFEGLGIELAGMAYDGEALFALVGKANPDIVITDISMPKMNGLEVVRRLNEAGSKCRVVIISGYKQFEYAYDALKYEVKNYLLKPIDEVELNQTLKKIVTEIRENRTAVEGQRYEETLRTIFLDSYINTVEVGRASIESVNNSFCTNFRPGLFQMISTKVNFLQEDRRMDTLAPSPLTSAFRAQVLERFAPFCFDVVGMNSYEGAMTLLNYPAEQAGQVENAIREMYVSIQEMGRRFSGTTVTMCVSERTSHLAEIHVLKEQIMTAEWYRMYVGIGKLIYYSHSIDAPGEEYGGRLSELREQVDKALEIYDARKMEACVDAFFDLPENVIASSAGLRFVLHIRGVVSSISGELLVTGDGETLNPGTMFRVMHFCSSFTMMRYEIKNAIARIFSVVQGNLSMIQSRPIRQIYAYIQQHYAEDVSLEALAGEAGLSPVYLSSLFKKETGVNVKEYITEYRIAKAKEMLKDGRKNISEVAYAAGFADVRYFSKLFKKTVGVKPSEYRKIYG